MLLQGDGSKNWVGGWDEQGHDQTVDGGLLFVVVSLLSGGAGKEGLFHIPRLAQDEHGSKFRGWGSLTKFNQDKLIGILSRFINENKEFK